MGGEGSRGDGERGRGGNGRAHPQLEDHVPNRPWRGIHLHDTLVPAEGERPGSSRTLEHTRRAVHCDESPITRIHVHGGPHLAEGLRQRRRLLVRTPGWDRPSRGPRCRRAVRRARGGRVGVKWAVGAEDLCRTGEEARLVTLTDALRECLGTAEAISKRLDVCVPPSHLLVRDGAFGVSLRAGRSARLVSCCPLTAGRLPIPS